MDAAKRDQNNLNGLIKIITGVISQSEQGTENVSSGKAKYQMLSKKSTTVTFITHQCLTSIFTSPLFFTKINFFHLTACQLQGT